MNERDFHPKDTKVFQVIDSLHRRVNAMTDEDAVRAAVSRYLGDEAFARTFVDCMSVIRRKNADYSQGEEKSDRIAAFRRIARDIDVPIAKAWAVFAQKHWGAIMRYVKEGSVESEPIEGRITDLINYLVLFREIVRQTGGEP